MLRGFKRAQQAIGATSVGEILHPFGAADYSTFMPRLRSMRPDILCICNFGRDQANSVKQAVDFGMNRQSKIVVPVLLATLATAFLLPKRLFYPFSFEYHDDTVYEAVLNFAAKTAVPVRGTQPFPDNLSFEFVEGGK